MRAIILFLIFLNGVGFCHEDGITKTIVASRGAEIKLRYQDLPPHQGLEISFAVHFVGPWDGTGFEQWAPDRFLCAIDKQRLIDSTFNNCHLIWSDNIWQSYPDPYHPDQNNAKPLGSHLYHGGTGAEAVASLGFAWGKKKSVDSSYRFRFVISHSDKDLEVKFWTDWNELETNPTTYWIEELAIRPIERLPSLNSSQQEEAWQALFSGDGQAAQKAWSEVFVTRPQLLVASARRLVEGNEERLNYLLKELQAGAVPTEALVREVPINPLAADAAERYRRVLSLRELALGSWHAKTQEWWDKEERSFSVRSVRKARGAGTFPESNPPLQMVRMRIASYLRMTGEQEAAEIAQLLDPQTAVCETEPGEEEGVGQE